MKPPRDAVARKVLTEIAHWLEQEAPGQGLNLAIACGLPCAKTMWHFYFALTPSYRAFSEFSGMGPDGEMGWTAPAASMCHLAGCQNLQQRSRPP